jgi:hypothetical protein
LNGYAHRLLFTFNVHPSSNLTAFPNLISGTYSRFADVAHGGYVQHTTTLNGQTVPADLIFTSDAAGSALLSWEIGSWNNVTGAIVAWVKADRSSSADTLIYTWIGNSGVTTYQCAASATWSNGYASVWHLGETLTGAGQDVHDSVGANNCSSMGTWVAQEQAAGKIGGSLAYSGSNSISCPHSTSLNPVAAFTVSAWYKLLGNDGSYAGILGNAYNQGYSVGVFYDGSGAGIWTGDGSTFGEASDGGSPIHDGGWHYVEAVYDGSQSAANRLHLFVDETIGAVLANAPATSADSAIATTMGVASKAAQSEIRLSSVARSVDWRAHEYAQQSQASAWYTVGSWMP